MLTLSFIVPLIANPTNEAGSATDLPLPLHRKHRLTKKEDSESERHVDRRRKRRESRTRKSTGAILRVTTNETKGIVRERAVHGASRGGGIHGLPAEPRPDLQAVKTNGSKKEHLQNPSLISLRLQHHILLIY